MSHSFLSGYYQIPIRSFQIQWGTFLFQIPQCNLIQKGANLLPTSFLSDSHQKKFWFFNAISILNQHTTRAAQPILIFVLKQPLLLQGGYGALEMSHSFPSDSYQIPIRSYQIQWGTFPFQIPQCSLIQKGANLLPISFLSDSHQKNLILQRNIDYKPAHHQGCSTNF